MAVQEITEETFAQAVQDNTLAFFDFYATWCGPCRAFGPIFDKASEANPDIFFGKIDDIIGQAKKLDVAAALAEAEKNGADPHEVLEEEEIQA